MSRHVSIGGDWHAHRLGRSIEDWIHPNRRATPSIHDDVSSAVDASREGTPDGVNEISAVGRRLETDDTAPEQAVQQPTTHGYALKSCGYGQGMGQNVTIVLRGRRSRSIDGSGAKWQSCTRITGESLVTSSHPASANPALTATYV